MEKMEDSMPKVDLSRFGVDLTDPASVMTLLESTELTEDEMEFLLSEAIRINKDLKEQLSREEDPEAGGEGGRSTGEGEGDGDSDYSSRGSSATSHSSGSSSAFGTYSVLPPIKNTDQKPAQKTTSKGARQ
ncbi:PREDICTED: uncharacterized protein LOC109469803 [Branchiostoma belcheri]|uniref:Uncharacterized protein LOC109469803 n=1 Tax=Branchiostoma belcheri TaxID=7741 RepID=A0A6P4YI03_BRABE|nr:PREDICTED: uncharacterized protein LOC109469803 [Branchiostoma belcheri]